MTDRTAQARAAYWEAHPGPVRGAALQADALRFGVEWADANPKPRTITRTAFEDAAQRIACDIYGDVTGVEDMLDDLGIEVTGDE